MKIDKSHQIKIEFHQYVPQYNKPIQEEQEESKNTNNEEYIELRKKADKLFKSRKYDKAEELYKKSIEMNKNYEKGYLCLGNFYLEKSKYQDTQNSIELIYKAIECFKNAINLKCDYVHAYLMLGDAYYQLHKKNEYIKEDNMLIFNIHDEDKYCKEFLQQASDYYLKADTYSTLVINNVAHTKYHEMQKMLNEIIEDEIDNGDGDELVGPYYYESFDPSEHEIICKYIRNNDIQSAKQAIDALHKSHGVNFVRSLTIGPGEGNDLVECAMIHNNIEVLHHLVSKIGFSFQKNPMPYQTWRDVLLITEMPLKDIETSMHKMFDRGEVNDLFKDLGWDCDP
jgi:tetratricopeptide (TPR) repeat protein